MLAIVLLLVLAVSGGLFAGTILYTAWNAAKLDRALSFIQEMWFLPFL